MQILNPSPQTQYEAQTQSAASLLAQATLYAASGGGRTFTADVGRDAGQYVATIPVVPGISASGDTRLTAESNINLRISLVV
jgi:hypothetical protein